MFWGVVVLSRSVVSDCLGLYVANQAPCPCFEDKQGNMNMDMVLNDINFFKYIEINCIEYQALGQEFFILFFFCI